MTRLPLSRPHFIRRYLLVAASLLLSAAAHPQTQNIPALPYRVIPDFFKLPEDWHPGEVSGIALNSKGHIFVFQRAKPMLAEFDPNGKFLREIGSGLFTLPHGLRIDGEDNIWTTDDRDHCDDTASGQDSFLDFLDIWRALKV